MENKKSFGTLAVVSNDLLSDILNKSEIVVRDEVSTSSFNSILNSFYEHGKFIYDDCSLVAINSDERVLRRDESGEENINFADCISGNYVVDDEPIGGVFTINRGSDEFLLVTKKFIDNALRLQENMKYLADCFKGDYSETEFANKYSMSEEIIKLRQQLQETEARLAEAEEPDFKTLGKKLNARSIEVRSGKRIRSQAVMLSLAIQGKTTNEIADVLSQQGYGNSCAAISRALSVIQPEDKDRLRGIMDSCPDEFGDVTDEDFEKWYSVRHKKAMKSYKKKLITQRVKAEMEKEFSETVIEEDTYNILAFRGSESL
ncbi:MAG: hypothetical protein K2M91_04215 [Lachnospiraceae bacterium]|nr:hypothetical protein [Lachnospiraceae bacterium]